MKIRAVEPADAPAWERMRGRLWPAVPEDHPREIAEFFDARGAEGRGEVFLAFDDAGEAIGLAEASIRRYAEGCSTDRVLYLEGWYVEERHRRTGIGAALVDAVAEWGRSLGCTEFASDTELGNEISARAHAALGFHEVERQICFRKLL